MSNNKKKITQQSRKSGINAGKRANEYKTDIRQTANKQVTLNKNKNRNKILLYLFFIIVLASVVFSNSLKNDFANWDDDDYIIKNTHIRELNVNSIKDIFTSFYFSNYHPITTITYAIEYKYSKLDALNYHVDNLILHLLNIILAFFFVYTLTRKINLSGIVALFFAIHPMHVESVVWVAERKDLLYTFFFLAGLITYIYYVNKHKTVYLALTYLLCILSLLSKSAAVCFPLVLILIDYYKKIKFDFKQIIIKALFFILALAMGITTVYAQKTSGAIADLTTGFTLFDRLFLVSYAALFYVVKLFVPFGLCAMHYYPVKHGSMLPMEYYAAPLIIIAIVFLIIRAGRYKKILVFGSLFYLSTIILVLQILPVGFAITSERYSYVPYIGLLFILGALFENVSESKDKNIKPLKPLFIGVIAIYTVLCSYLSFNRNPVWQNGIVLFTDVIEKNPESFHGYWIRGSAYSNKKDYKEAIADFDEALLRKAPNPAEVLNNRGDAKNNIDNYKGALEDLNQAIKLKHNLTEAYCNRGNARDNLGDYKGAIEDFDKALSLKPDMITAFINKGVTLGKMGKMDESIKIFDKAISTNPDDASAYLNRGNAKGIIKDFKGSIADYDMSIKLKGNESGAFFNRAISKLALKDTVGACQDWEKALSLGNKAAESPIERICNKH